MNPTRCLEMHYTPDEVALLLRLCRKTVLLRLREGLFGAGVVNIGSGERPDYRIPASGINAYLEQRRVFTEPGIAARTVGELRRKVAASSDA